MNHYIKVTCIGATCDNCTGTILRALRQTDGVLRAGLEGGIHHQKQIVRIESEDELDEDTITTAIDNVGFSSERFTRGTFEDIDSILAEEEQPDVALLDRSSTQAGILLFFGLSMMVLSMGAKVVPEADTTPGRITYGVYGAVSIGIGSYFGKNYFKGAWKTLKSQCTSKRQRLDMNTLIAISAIAAWSYSTWVITDPEALDGFSSEVYFHVPLMVLGLLRLSAVLKEWISDQVHSQIKDQYRALFDLQPKVFFPAEGVEAQPIRLVEAGTEVFISGEEENNIIPVDGTIVGGKGLLNEASHSGDDHEIHRGEEDTVFAGTKLLHSDEGITIKARYPAHQNSIVQTILDLKMATGSQTKFSKKLDSIAAIIVPILLATSFAAYITWSAIGPQPRQLYALKVLLATLLSACPCALGALPLAASTLRMHAMKNGMLIRDEKATDDIQEITHFVFDKTGTLTQPSLSAENIHIFSEERNPEQKFAELSLAAEIERHIENPDHPIAQAIIQCASKTGRPSVASISREGVSQNPDNHLIQYNQILIGASFAVIAAIEALSEEKQFDQHLLDQLKRQVDGYSDQGITPVLMVNFDELNTQRNFPSVTVFPIRHTPRPNAADVLQSLYQAGKHIAILSGDKQQACVALVNELDLPANDNRVVIIGDATPESKKYQLKKIKVGSPDVEIAMVGDGANDISAMNSEDVTLSIGIHRNKSSASGANLILNGDLSQILTFYKYSKALDFNYACNGWFALIYNCCAMSFAAVGSYYFTGGDVISPTFASMMMIGSSLIVTALAYFPLQWHLNWIDAQKVSSITTCTDERRSTSDSVSVVDPELGRGQFFRFHLPQLDNAGQKKPRPKHYRQLPG